MACVAANGSVCSYVIYKLTSIYKRVLMEHGYGRHGPKLVRPNSWISLLLVSLSLLCKNLVHFPASTEVLCKCWRPTGSSPGERAATPCCAGSADGAQVHKKNQSSSFCRSLNTASLLISTCKIPRCGGFGFAQMVSQPGLWGHSSWTATLTRE